MHRNTMFKGPQRRYVDGSLSQEAISTEEKNKSLPITARDERLYQHKVLSTQSDVFQNPDESTQEETRTPTFGRMHGSHYE